MYGANYHSPAVKNDVHHHKSKTNYKHKKHSMAEAEGLYKESEVEVSEKRSRAISLSLDWDNIVGNMSSKDGMIVGGKHYYPGAIATERPKVIFCTKSKYTGKWNSLGMSNDGTYTFPYGVVYEGSMQDGMFHGEGILTYPMGQMVTAIWEHGKMVSYKFCNVDGLDYKHPWSYCKMPDRRFHVSIREGLQPAPQEFQTNQQPTRPIEPGYYDTCDGFYNPKNKSINFSRDPDDYEYATFTRTDPSLFSNETEEYWPKGLTIASRADEKWIIKNCRKSTDDPAGYRPDLYEDWVTGRAAELALIQAKYEDKTAVMEESEDEEDEYSIEEERKAKPDIAEDELLIDYAGTGRKLVAGHRSSG